VAKIRTRIDEIPVETNLDAKFGDLWTSKTSAIKDSHGANNLFGSTPTVNLHDVPDLFALKVITSKYYIFKKRDIIEIRDRSNSSILAAHEIKNLSFYDSLLLKDESKVVFHSSYSLYILDLVDVSQPPVLIEKSDSSFKRILSGLEEDREVAIVSNDN